MSFLETKFAAFVLAPQKPTTFVLAPQKPTTFAPQKPTTFAPQKPTTFVLAPQKLTTFVLASQKLTAFVFRRPFFRQQAREGKSRYYARKGSTREWNADNIGIQYPEQ